METLGDVILETFCSGVFFATLVGVLLYWVGMKVEVGKPRSSAPPPARGLTKEEEEIDAIAGEMFGREMGWWD